MIKISRCFEDPYNEDGNQIPVDEIFFDEGSNDYRVKILKSHIPKAEDWSIAFAQLYKEGFSVLGITSDRYDDYIFIWVKQRNIWEGIE